MSPSTSSSAVRAGVSVKTRTNSSNTRSAADTGAASRSPRSSARATSSLPPCNCRKWPWEPSQYLHLLRPET